MSATTQPFTAEQLLHMPEDGYRYELVEGVLIKMSPPGFEHGDVALTIGSLLWQHVRAHKLGRVVAAETGFKLASDPDTVLAPDAAFIRQSQNQPLDRKLQAVCDAAAGATRQQLAKVRLSDLVGR